MLYNYKCGISIFLIIPFYLAHYWVVSLVTGQELFA